MRRVIILGGGYAGLHAFAALKAKLRRQIKSGTVKVTLISKDPYHTYHGWTGEVLSGRLGVERTLTPLVPLLRDHFLEGRVTSVDLDDRSLTVEGASGRETLKFDHLVMATGSRDPFTRIEGLAEHGWCLKDTSDMQRLVERLDQLDSEGRAPRSVAVIGGGFAGTEAASALAERFNRSGAKTIVHLVSAREQILDGLRPDFNRIANHATSVLAEQGVRLHAGRRVRGIAPGHVQFEDGESLMAELTIAAAGIAFQTIPGTERLPRTSTGQIVTAPDLQVPAHAGIWAAGDISAVAHPGGGEACPANALWAMKQGDCVGANIARAIGGRPTRQFRFKGMGQAAGLAAATGITELHRMQFTGRLAWLIRILFFAWYMPSRSRGVSIAWDLLAGFGAPRRKPARASGAELGEVAAGGTAAL